MFDNRLQGATVTEVYWAVNHPHWVPTIGKKFTDPVEARRYAEDVVTADSPRAMIETRMVFKYHPNRTTISGTLDTMVAREYAEYKTVIRRLSED